MDLGRTVESAPLSEPLSAPIIVPTQLFHSDAVPSKQQALSIGAAVDDAERKLEQIDSEISHASEVLERLHAKREEIEAYRDKHKAILSPIRLCPPEILSEIFLLCCLGDKGLAASITRAPLLLTTICHHWRRIALSTPRLWTSITLTIDGTREVSEHRAKGATTWLERAAPLALSVELEYKGRKDTQKHTSLVVGVVVTFANRCESLSLQMPSRFIRSFEDATGPFTHLAKLRIYEVNHNLVDHDIGRSFSPFASASMLRVVDLKSSHSDIVLPWHQMTRISLSPFTHRSWATIARCEGLVELHFHYCPFLDSIFVPDTTPLVLMKLEILQLESSASLDQVLNRLMLPALRELTLFKIGNSETLWTPDAFTSFAGCSGFNLHKITLFAPSPEGVVQLLRDCPSVSHLLLFPGSPSFLERHLEDLMHGDGPRKRLAPHLEKLTCVARRDWSRVAIRKLSKMVRSRGNGSLPAPCLREVHVDISNKNFKEEELVELSALTGVEFRLALCDMPKFQL